MAESLLPSLSLLIFRLDLGWRSDVGCYPVHISPAPCVTRCSHLGEIRFISEEKLQKIAIQKLTKIQSSTCKFYKGSAKIFIYKIRYYYCSMCRYFSSFYNSQFHSNHRFSTSYLYWLKKYGDKYSVSEREEIKWKYFYPGHLTPWPLFHLNVASSV